MSGIVPLLLQLIPLGLVAAWSPLKVIPAVVLVLNSPHPRRAGLAFIAGSLAGLAAATFVFVWVPGLLDDVEPPHGWGGYMQLIAGALLAAFGVYRWTNHQRRLSVPAWIVRLTHITPGAALVLGLALSILNLKVMLMNAAAGLAISLAQVGPAGTVVGVAFYTLLAGSTIVLPILGYHLASEAVDRWLQAAKRRIDRHRDLSIIASSFLLGIALICTGIWTLIHG